MRVLLIQPPSLLDLVDKVYMFEPLALEYIASGLISDGHHVDIVDGRMEPDLEKKVILDFNPDIVGITAFTTHVNIVKRLASEINDKLSNCLTVIGGHHATVSPDDFADSDFDLIVIGEGGVNAMREITLAHSFNESFNMIEGIGIIGEGEIKYTPARTYTLLDELPFPDRLLTKKNIAKHISVNGLSLLPLSELLWGVRQDATFALYGL